MMKTIYAVAAVLLLSGCASTLSDINRGNRTTFTPISEGIFHVTAEDSPARSMSAQDHINEWIDAYIKENSACVSGYSIAEMQKVYLRNDWPFGNAYTRHYTVTCAKGP